MSLEVSLSAFEGPLDLLLTLIEKNKVSIYDIPIAVIADQYLETVKQLPEDLDTLSDFLVMAATLIDIKARMLLPKETDENGEEIDPRTELVERLIEYQEYKMMAGELKEVYDADAYPLFREPGIPEEVKAYRPAPDYDAMFRNVTLERLRDVFTMVMEREAEKVDTVRSGFGKIEKDPVRISERLSHVMDYGRSRKKFSFKELLLAQPTKAEVVVTFLACLELIHIGQISVSQEETFGDIDLLWNDDCEMTISKEDIEAYD